MCMELTLKVGKGKYLSSNVPSRVKKHRTTWMKLGFMVVNERLLLATTVAAEGICPHIYMVQVLFDWH